MTGTAPLLTTTQMIEAFAAGEISREEAMELLRMSSYSQLLNALADRGIAPPKPPPEQVEAELAGAMPVLRMMEACARAGGNGGKTTPGPWSDPLQAFAQGLLSHRQAIRAGRLRDYAELLAALGAAGLAPPRAPEAGIEAEAALFLRIRDGGMGRAVLLIAEDAPLWSLRAAGRLDLLLRLGMEPAPPDRGPGQAPPDPGVLVLDGVLDAVAHDAEIGAFIRVHSPPFAVEKTWAGEVADRRRRAGKPPRTNAADVALADFLTAGGGIDRYLGSGDPFLVLCDRIRGLCLFGAPSNLHRLSTAGLLAGLEKAGVIPSAGQVLHDMLHPAGR